MAELFEVLLSQWQELRQLTYDLLDGLGPHDFDRKLPFATSQTLGYQFWCMLGAQESYFKKLQHGEWQGFASSLDQFDVMTAPIISQQMQLADRALANLLATLPTDHRLQNGQLTHEVVFQMIKHESHHHGQLINFIFCHRLPIPPSWQEEWALRYDET